MSYGSKLPWRIALEPLLNRMGEKSGGPMAEFSSLASDPSRLVLSIKFDGLVVGESSLRVTPRLIERAEGSDGLRRGQAEEIVFRKRKVGPALSQIASFPLVKWAGGKDVIFLPTIDPLVVEIDVGKDGGMLVQANLQDVKKAAGSRRARVVGEDPCWIWLGEGLVQVSARLPSVVLDLMLDGITIPASDQDEFLSRYLPPLRRSGLELIINGRSFPSTSRPPETFLDLSEDSRGLWARLKLRYGKQEVVPAAATQRDRRGVWEERALGDTLGLRNSRAPEALHAQSRPEEILLRDLAHEQNMTELLEDVCRTLSLERSRGTRIVRPSQGISKDKALARGTIIQPDAGSLLMNGQVALQFLYEDIERLRRVMKVRGEDKLKLYRISRARGQVSLQVGIEGKNIDFKGQLETGEGTAAVGRIVRSLASGTRFVRLDSGSIAELPADWVKHDTWTRFAGELPAETRKNAGQTSLKLPLHMIGWILECGELTGSLEETDAWRSFKEKLLDFEGIESIPIPEGLGTELRPYQARCLDWLSFLNENSLGGILADDMGLGKTVQALALLLHLRLTREERGTSLIVCPTSVLENWRREAERFTPQLEVELYHGRSRAKILEKAAEYDILLTTYGVLRRDMKPLKTKRFLYVILDESQNIKSLSTATTVSAFNLNAEHRLCLTGTPVENSALELYSQMNFLMPGILGSVRRFKKSFLEGEALTRKDRLETLRNRVKPFLLRRTKEQVTPELPEKQEIQLTCVLEGGPLRLYREILAMSREEVFTQVDSQGLGRSHMTILQALLRLRQVCCHPALLKKLDPKVAHMSSTKLEMLMEILENIVSEGHKVLIFSQFTSMLALIRERFDEIGQTYLYLDGKTRNRQDLVDRFNDGGPEPIFLMSLKAGGTGLNLTGADYVIHYDPWWNPAVMDQATARTHRIGQTRKVLAYNLIVKDSIEEKVLKLADRKRSMARELIPTDEAFGKALTREDLEELFAPLP